MSTEIGNISCICVICRKTLMNIYNYPKKLTCTLLREMLPMLLDNTYIKILSISICIMPLLFQGLVA